MGSSLISLFLIFSLLCSCTVTAVESPAPSFRAETQSPAQTETLQTDADLTADDIAQVILTSQSDREDYLAQVDREDPAGGDLALYLELYGVDRDAVSDAAIYTAGGVDAREVAVLDLYHGSLNYDTASAAEALEDYLERRYADFYGYEPEQAALVEKGQVVEGDGWVALLICQDGTAAREALGPLTGVEPEPTPAPAEPTPTPDPEARYRRDERGYLPFLPPNEVDMTLYDTAPIRAAYASGEEGDLSEKDAAILEKCRKIISACLEEGMTDFEKELALHDWLVKNMAYDQSVHDPETPEGLPDNKDPYGGLVKGYGICLGYATSFQLLMDLAGVECLTVVGASGWSREDHAWNLVKLEGEWYCVDLTWDDTTISNPGAYSNRELSRRRHIYFNVTSDNLRGNNHQWDYDNVPEATATRFRWDGTGKRPS